LDQAAKAEVKAAVEFAANSPEPEIAALEEDVYAMPWSGRLLPRMRTE
jgi:TPP-dependent pyruvate/acetoin dehydrogenase alpha subunit